MMEKSSTDATSSSPTTVPKVDFDPENDVGGDNDKPTKEQSEPENPVKIDERLTLKRKPALEEGDYRLGDFNLPGTNKSKKNPELGFGAHVFKGPEPDLHTPGKTIFHDVNPYISKDQYVAGTRRCNVALPGLPEAIKGQLLGHVNNPINAIQIPLKVTGLKTLALASAATYFGSQVAITVAEAVIKAATSPPPLAVGTIATGIADYAVDLSVQHAENMSRANAQHTRCMEQYRALKQLF